MDHTDTAAAERGARRKGHGQGKVKRHRGIRRRTPRRQDIARDKTGAGLIRHRTAEMTFNMPDRANWRRIVGTTREPGHGASQGKRNRDLTQPLQALIFGSLGWRPFLENTHELLSH